MSRRVADWGTVAEVISAIAIVFSLIFVGIQVRQNTISETLSSYDRLYADLINWRMQLATNPETLDAFNTFVESDEPIRDGSIQTGRAALLALWQIYERAYFARSYGRLGDAEWGRYQKSLCQPRSAGIRAKLNQDLFSDEFWRFWERCGSE